MAESLETPGDSLASCAMKEFKASDGYRWRYRRYRPFGMARAHVVCLHGIQSHGGWYETSSRRLSQAGFAVDFLDRRGSGVNQVQRGDTPSFHRLVDDVAEYLQSLRLLPPLPIFLVGISWGGKVAVALQRSHPGLVDGLALLCPGFYPRMRPSLRQRLAILAARLMNPGKLFPIPLNDPELFTATPRWRKFIRDDALSLHQATARFLVESVRLDAYLRRVPPFVHVPILLMLAEQDRIIGNGPTRRFIEQFATTDKEILEYPGAHHTLEFEPDPERFIKDLEAWVEQQTTALIDRRP